MPWRPRPIALALWTVDKPIQRLRNAETGCRITGRFDHERVGLQTWTAGFGAGVVFSGL